MGQVEIRVPNEERQTANNSTITVRVSLAANATVQEVEAALLREAQDHLNQVVQIFAEGSPESLRQLAKDYVPPTDF